MAGAGAGAGAGARSSNDTSAANSLPRSPISRATPSIRRSNAASSSCAQHPTSVVTIPSASTPSADIRLGLLKNCLLAARGSASLRLRQAGRTQCMHAQRGKSYCGLHLICDSSSPMAESTVDHPRFPHLISTIRIHRQNIFG